MIEIWHNPRCSKSRQTLALVEARDQAFSERRYLEDSPSEAEIRTVLAALGGPAIDMMRSGEKLFKELGLSRESDEASLIAAMADNPILIERPIVLHQGKARIGRPPESVLEIL